MSKSMKEMAPICSLYDVDFNNFTEEHDLGKAAMSKSIKEMAPICFLYDVDFNYFTEEHDLGKEEDLNGKVHLVRGDISYNA